MGCGFSKHDGRVHLKDVNIQPSKQSDQEAIDLTDIYAECTEECTPQNLDEIPFYSAVSGCFRLSSEGIGINISADETSHQNSRHSVARGGSESQLAEQKISCQQAELKAFLKSCETEPAILKKAVRAKRENGWLRHEIPASLTSPVRMLAEDELCHMPCRLAGAETPSSSTSSLSQ
eukprot:TRINITY_DN24101_c0_g2_i1.p1 TRINITY_DN24101_c0_g2~~TRINITY_DN24101_c0_g2_i1.p1  ORF type:complete len:177 (+),score=18.32 TRINITY_DN24101_c0_g2_i1:50-580(+)